MLPDADLGSPLRKKLLHPNIPENTKNSRKICKTGNFRGRGEEIYYMYCTGRTESSYYSLGQHFNQFYRGGAEGGGQGERGVNKFQPEQLELET
jgi:hypothetical protein